MKLNTCTYTFFLFYISETYGLKMVVLVEPKLEAI